MMGSLGLPGSGDCSNLVLHGDLIVGSAAEAGLVWLPLNCGELTAAEPEAPALASVLGAWPNPFNPRTSLSFELPRASQVRLSIHDVAGRCVRTLAGGDFAAGMHALIWDGRDDRGTESPSGIYLARLEAGETAGSAKLVLLR